MTLGTFAFLTSAARSLPILPVAQAGPVDARGLLPALVPPTLVMFLCIGAGVGTYFLLPRRNSHAGVRATGGAFILLAALVLAVTLARTVIQTSGGGPGAYFWVFSAIALFGALRVVTHARPVYAALYFVLTVFATAGLFILLWAEFMAVALVIIYAGAILVTYVFVIMLAASTTQAGVDKLAEYDAVSRDPILASAVGFVLMGMLLFVVFDRAEPLAKGTPTYTYTGVKAIGERRIDVTDEVNAPDARTAQAMLPRELSAKPGVEPEPASSVQALGRYLFREQAVNLELSGLILTLGMIGAILIARRRVLAPAEAAGRFRDALVAPATPINDDPHSIPVFGTDKPGQKAYPET